MIEDFLLLIRKDEMISRLDSFGLLDFYFII